MLLKNQLVSKASNNHTSEKVDAIFIYFYAFLKVQNGHDNVSVNNQSITGRITKK